MWRCYECGKTFKTDKAAEKAMSIGCPKCGGVDIDLAPTPDLTGISTAPKSEVRK